MSFRIIDKRESPRYIKKMRLKTHYVHNHKPVMLYIEEMSRYLCECGNYIKPSKVKEHSKI